jgi:hypothetical protein
MKPKPIYKLLMEVELEYNRSLLSPKIRAKTSHSFGARKAV